MMLKRTIAMSIGGLWGDEPTGGPDDVAVVRVADFAYGQLGVSDAPTIRSVPHRLQQSRRLRPGDLLLEKSGGGDQQNVGRVVMWHGPPEQSAITSNFITVLRTSKGFDPNYLVYLHRHLYASGYAAAATKQTTGIQNLDVAAYLATWTAVPSIERQLMTSAFLDRECARVDDLAAELREVIQLEDAALEAHRERLLDKQGIPKRIKFGLRAVIDTVHATCPQVQDGGHWVIRTSGVRGGRILKDGCYETDASSYAEWTKRRKPRAGDVVLTREAPAGEAAVITAGDRWCLGQRSVLLIVDPARLDPDYLVVALYGRLVRDEIAIRSRSTTAAHLNVGEIGELSVPMPDLDEQRHVVGHVANARRRIDDLLSETTAFGRALVEYRNALITEAVTGVLDVSAMSEARMDESLAAVCEGETPEVLAK